MANYKYRRIFESGDIIKIMVELMEDSNYRTSQFTTAQISSFASKMIEILNNEVKEGLFSFRTFTNRLSFDMERICDEYKDYMMYAPIQGEGYKGVIIEKSNGFKEFFKIASSNLSLNELLALLKHEEELHEIYLDVPKLENNDEKE